MKRIIIIVIVLIIIINTLGCIDNSKKNDNNENDKKSIPPLNILLTNKDVVNYNGSLLVKDEYDNTIYETNFSLDQNEIKDIKNITNQKGKYFIRVIIEDNRTQSYPVYVSEYAYYVYVNLYHDEIKITQIVE